MSQLFQKTMMIKNEKYSNYSASNVYLKCENLQKSGSVQLRLLEPVVEYLTKQGINKLSIKSNNNCALALASLKEYYDFDLVVIMPENTSLDILAKLYKSNVVVLFNNKDNSLSVLEDNGYANYTLINRNYEVQQLQAVNDLVKEILNDLPKTNIIMVPLSSGLLAYGVQRYITNNNLDISVIGVSSKGSSVLSYEENDNTEINYVHEFLSKSNKSYEVSDDELVDAFLDVMDEQKMIADYKALQAVAGTKYIKGKGHNIVCLVTSGNIDSTTLSTTILAGLKNNGRIFTFKVMLSDKPGQLLEVASIIAKHKGNVVEINHNQFKTISRKNKVELIVTVESLDLNHKYEICSSLEKVGYEIILLDDHLGGEYYG